MSKRLIITSLFSFILIFILSFASAGLFHKYQITGDVILPPTGASCNDSDGGYNIYTKGYLIDMIHGLYYEDSCNEKTLREYYCRSSNYQSAYYNCSYGCVDGACVQKPLTSFTSNESNVPDNNGYNPEDFIDSKNYSLLPINNCVDSDNGIDSNIKGDTMLKSLEESQIWIDYCENATVLNESYCENNLPKTILINCITDNKLCLNGACAEKDKGIYSCGTGCFFNQKCYPAGSRIGIKFCSENRTFLDQSSINHFCNNDFECKTDKCVSNQCVSNSFINRLFSNFNKG